MNEYISRDEAINAIKSLESSMPAKDNYAKGYDAALGRVLIEVRKVPTSADVQPVRHGRWISVDDKLPDTVDDCLVWYSCDTAFGKSKSVGISFCSRDDWYKKHLNGDNIVVLYWMPLPEPPQD